MTTATTQVHGYNWSGQNRQRREDREYGPKVQYYAPRGEYIDDTASRGAERPAAVTAAATSGSVRTETQTSPANNSSFPERAKEKVFDF